MAVMWCLSCTDLDASRAVAPRRAGSTGGNKGGGCGWRAQHGAEWRGAGGVIIHPISKGRGLAPGGLEAQATHEASYPDLSGFIGWGQGRW
jgi:hypothetical protein